MSNITGLKLSQLQSLGLGSTGTLFYAASAGNNSYKISEKDLYQTLYKLHLSGVFQPKDEDWRFVHKTGDESITGVKTFVNPIEASEIHLDGNTDLKIDMINQIIYDENGSTSIDWLNRYLNVPGAGAVVDWHNQLLQDLFGVVSIDWDHRILSGNWIGQNLNLNSLKISGNYVVTGNNTVDSQINALSGYVDAFTVHRINQERISGAKTFINNITFSGGITTFYPQPPKAQAVNDVFSNNGISFLNDYLIVDDGGAQKVMVDWSGGLLINGLGDTRLDWKNKILSGTWGYQGLSGINLTGHNITAMHELAAPIISAATNSDTYIDVTNRSLYDSGPFLSIDWNNYILYENGSEALDWANGVLYDYGNNITLNWNNSLLNTNGASSLDWGNKILYGNWSTQGRANISGTLSTSGDIFMSSGRKVFSLTNANTGNWGNILYKDSGNLDINYRSYIDPEWIRIREDFVGGGNADQQRGEMGWRQTNIVGTATFGSTASSNHPGIVSITTPAVSGQGGSVSCAPGGQAPIGNNVTGPWQAYFIFQLSQTGSTNFIAGFANATDTPTRGTWVRYNTRPGVADTGFMFETFNSGPDTVVSSDIQADTNWHVVRMWKNYTAESVVYFQMDTGAIKSVTQNDNSAARYPVFILKAETGSAVSVNIDYFGYEAALNRLIA